MVQDSETTNTGQLLSPASNYVTSFDDQLLNRSGLHYVCDTATERLNHHHQLHLWGLDGWRHWANGRKRLGKLGGNQSVLFGRSRSELSDLFYMHRGRRTLFPVPNANANFGADIDGWVTHYMAKYTKNFHDDLRAAGSNILYFGLESVGSWGSPPNKGILQGEAPYVDMAFMNNLLWFAPTTVFNPTSTPGESTEFPSVYQYTTRYWGDKPLGNSLEIAASSRFDESFNVSGNADSSSS